MAESVRLLWVLFLFLRFRKLKIRLLHFITFYLFHRGINCLMCFYYQPTIYMSREAA